MKVLNNLFIIIIFTVIGKPFPLIDPLNSKLDWLNLKLSTEIICNSNEIIKNNSVPDEDTNNKSMNDDEDVKKEFVNGTYDNVDRIEKISEWKSDLLIWIETIKKADLWKNRNIDGIFKVNSYFKGRQLLANNNDDDGIYDQSDEDNIPSIPEQNEKSGILSTISKILDSLSDIYNSFLDVIDSFRS